MATTFSFDEINRIITVGGDPLPTEVTIQQLINAIRDWEDDLDNMDATKVADASGKDLLAAGLQTGITLRLYNWRVKFADRPPPNTILCEIRGGNLVALDADGQPMNPVAPSAYVMVVRTSDTSAGLVTEWTQAEKDDLLAQITTETGEIDSAVAEAQAQVLETQLQVQGVYGEVLETQAQVQTVDGKVVDTQTQIQTVDGKVVDTQGQVQDVQTGLDEAKAKTGGAFDRDTDSLEAISDKTGEVKIPRGFKV